MIDKDDSEGDVITLEIEERHLRDFTRLDQFLAHNLTHLSRSFLKTLFKQDRVISNARLELSRMPPAGTIIKVLPPPPLPSEIQAENLPLEILHEDRHLLFVNKPAGMVTHPAPGNYSGTLANAVLYHCPDLDGPGIVHRLDKGTSGVMVVAKSRQCHEGLAALFSEHDIDRVYSALVMGSKMPARGSLNGTIGRDSRNRLKMAVNVPRGRSATTHYRVLESFKKAAYLELRLETGRTHQIRVHLSSLLKAAVICDPLYGNPPEHLSRLGGEVAALLKDWPHPLLHARKLGLVHPMTGEKIDFEVPLPDIFERTLEALRS